MAAVAPHRSEEVNVGARSSHTVSLNLELGQAAAWRFVVAGGVDIGFQAVFKGDDGSTVEAFPSTRLAADAGSFCACVRGALTLTLDNSFSLMRGKTVALDWGVRRALGPDSLDVAATEALMLLDSEAANVAVMKGVELFFTNRFTQSEAYFAKDAAHVPVFALAHGTLAFLRAFMTWEPGVIADAGARLRAAQGVASTYMPKSGMFSGSASNMTVMQLEGTLVHAEATMLPALLHLMEESIMGMVRCGMAIRSGYQLYVQCDRMLDGCVSAITGGAPLNLERIAPLLATPAASAEAAAAPGSPSAASPVAVSMARAMAAGPKGYPQYLVGGVQFGMGIFNTFASVFPPIVLRIIAALGFPCDREAGMEQLRQCLLGGGVRGPLAALQLLVMRVLIPSFHSGDISEHVPEAEAVLALMLHRYTDSALFLWMGGRLARMKGDVVLAKERFQRCASIQTDWVQLAHLCSYELGWCHAFSHDWDAMLPLFAQLQADNEWSKAFYAYMQAIALVQLGRLSEARVRMRDVVRLGNRKLGGKVISAEQYAVRRAAEFLAHTRGAADDAEEEVSQLIRVKVPESVPRGSRAHAAALGYAAPFLGLESVYLYNGAAQMDPDALASAIRQIDAVLEAVTRGESFNASARVWTVGPAAEDAAGSAWSDARRETSSPTSPTVEATAATAAAVLPARAPEDLQRSFDAAARVDMNGLGPSPSSPAAASRFSIGRLVSSLVSSAAASGPVATASQLLPLHTVAIAALCRGAFASNLGRVDEAAAAFSWAIAKGAAGELRRELHVYAHALYEMGVIYADAVKALQRVEAGGTAAGRLTHSGVNILESNLLRGLTAAAARTKAREYLQKARDIRDDFDWKVRLHLRIHLSLDELRSKPGRRGGGAAGVANPVGLGISPADEEAMLAAAAAADATGDEGEGGDEDD